ncbi:hypothetical protein TGMAS_281470 [Toxoplasma gondii MAS]|uniref:Uncharacterized protein n=1 Tax=Toxoplasma gondii MAS TaxID=943118 RepID=A0A086Q0L6_TOXGO|nr:hypothetical protein TGMAS_281470 [Toxoplasma gondii MAS]
MKVFESAKGAAFSRSAIVVGLLAAAGVSTGASADLLSVTSETIPFPTKHTTSYSASFDHSAPVVTDETPSLEPESVAFTTSPVPQYSHELNGEVHHRIADEETWVEKPQHKNSEHLMYDMHQDMKDRFWHLNEESAIEKLISEGLLDPSWGHQFDMNFVPTFQEDLFDDIFSEEEPSLDAFLDGDVYTESDLFSHEVTPQVDTNTEDLPIVQPTTEVEITTSSGEPVPEEAGKTNDMQPQPSEAPDNGTMTTAATADVPTSEESTVEETAQENNLQVSQTGSEKSEARTDDAAQDDAEKAGAETQKDAPANILTTTTTTASPPAVTEAAGKPAADGPTDKEVTKEVPAVAASESTEKEDKTNETETREDVNEPAKEVEANEAETEADSNEAKAEDNADESNAEETTNAAKKEDTANEIKKEEEESETQGEDSAAEVEPAPLATEESSTGNDDEEADKRSGEASHPYLRSVGRRL